jgi:hypothetical protein
LRTRKREMPHAACVPGQRRMRAPWAPCAPAADSRSERPARHRPCTARPAGGRVACRAARVVAPGAGGDGLAPVHKSRRKGTSER